MFKKIVGIGLLASLPLIVSPAKADENLIVRYLTATPQERICMHSDPEISDVLSDLLLDLDRETRRALIHERIMSVEPLEYNDYRVDLEGLLNLEKDNGEIIPLTVEIYGAKSDEKFNKIIQMVKDFYLENFKIKLNFRYKHTPFKEKKLDKGPKKLRIVFSSEEDEINALFNAIKKREAKRYEGTDKQVRGIGGLGIAYAYSDAATRTTFIYSPHVQEVLTRKSQEGVNIPYDILIARTIAHELGHMAGLWHPRDAITQTLVPELVPVPDQNDGFFYIDNFMGDTATPYLTGFSGIDAAASDFQKRQMRSFFRDGIARTILEEERFDLGGVMKRVERFQNDMEYKTGDNQTFAPR